MSRMYIEAGEMLKSILIDNKSLRSIVSRAKISSSVTLLKQMLKCKSFFSVKNEFKNFKI